MWPDLTLKELFDRTKEQIQTLIRLNVEANLEITHELLKLRNRIRLSESSM